ncbi:sigma-54-dependent Fis family transcriptional regulator [Methylibium petroleiphilum]|uniref:sigma-54-dependent Fis family transcriptional regulator n=1 Tax=Methylibium petroleiphilum TaxID=105560 RepID=UPI001AD15685|nr:sigma-54-dependent Fis family transcriptional regulator [Methylibium petroleiphilum]MBN9203980.1 sigma-54-dependent Fis family transcriptional regulator [Methylibium petroleiphilum]
MISERTQHIDNVVSVVTNPIDEASEKSRVYKSWARCVNDYGLDPSRPTPARILPSQEVREHQQQIEEFLRVARSGMEDMYRRVADLGYMLLLTDAAGITVDYIGNPAWDSELRAAGLYLGADWNEAHAGTCGVGTCLIEQTPITCHQAEHFDATHIGLTCTTAPLFDPNGKLLAVFDVSALRSPRAKDSQHLVFHLTSMYAQMIEDANFLRHFRKNWILRLGKSCGLVDVSGDTMLAFDDDGLIVGANTGARAKLWPSARGRQGGALVGRSLSEVFATPMEAIWRIARAGTGLDVSVTCSEPREHYYATVVAPREKGSLTSLLADRPVAVSTVARSADSFPALDRLAGGDPAMDRLLVQAKRLVDRKVNILIHGETGSGKEVFAKALHESSSRARMPFIAVNCASIPESLIESELFGYTPGSFTGGKSKGMKGLILQAHGGTLFLDEIGDMPLHLQTRFLRVLSESEVLPLGAERPIPVDFTVVAATHRDLRDRVAAGTFREDLYYRLCGATMSLPALRERADKRYLIESVFNDEAKGLTEHAGISAEAMELLLTYSWPGNIRELRNVLRFALAISGDGPVTVDDLPQEIGMQRLGHGRPLQLQARLGDEGIAMAAGADDIDAERLLNSLKRNKWNITLASQDLKVCRATVYRQMKRFKITPPNHQ